MPLSTFVAHPAASAYPPALQAALLIILLLATCVWLGGWVSLILIAHSTTVTLSPAARVEFFRHYGRLYDTTSTVALGVAFASGLILLLGMPWVALSTWLVVVCALLVTALGAGVVQARRLTRLRRELAARPDDSALASGIAATARRAIALRASLGVISLAILMLGVLRMM